jgi:hypothetical protein
VSGLSPINERSNARKRWNALRQAVNARSVLLREARVRNRALLKLVENLDKETKKATKVHANQMNRLYKHAVAIGALHDPNYRNARMTAVEIHKKALRSLHGMRNKVVNELMRNSKSSQIRRNLYEKGVERGKHGTSQNNWQNWSNKLWHLTERKNQMNQFFKSLSRA